ncbi:MAG: VWA domain-containing protein [Acidobacteria bacterium]|nr:VWA domain-containing protein [Acidobacteriota bacterium]MCA1640820.1 VWA domain-containing protein [Acidobacteriota bacterium]
MKPAVKLFLITAAFGATAWALAARAIVAAQQQPQPAASRPAPTPPGETSGGTVNVRIVRLPITVLDKKDQPVAGLAASDFEVFEDKQPQRIESFTDEKTGVPVHVAVLLDISGSTAGKLGFEKEAAKDFLYTVVRARKDRGAFAVFDENVNLLQDFTDKLDLLDKAVDSVKKPGSDTALWDAVWLMCDEKMRGTPGRRVMVLITDGDDTASRAKLKDAIEIAQATETTVFAISTKAGLSGVVPGVQMGTPKDDGDRELDRLCAETGGKAFFIGDKLGLEKSFHRVARELRAQYVVTYRPQRAFDGSYRRIEVKLASERDGLKVRTRRGYTATRESKE